MTDTMPDDIFYDGSDAWDCARHSNCHRYLRADTVQQKLEVADRMAKILQIFSSSLDKASNVIREDADHDMAHIVRTTTFWLAYNDFLEAQAALTAYKTTMEK